MKNVLFRIPTDIKESFHIELEWRGINGQTFVEKLVRKELSEAAKSSRKYERNEDGETRNEMRGRLDSYLRGDEAGDKGRTKKRSKDKREKTFIFGRNYFTK